MSKETTAKGIDIVRKNVSETHQEVLRTLGVLDERGLFALEVDEGIKTVAATPVDANKVQVLGTVYATFGPIKQGITLFLNQKGEVFASSDIKTQTGFKRVLPVFVDKSHAGAWKAFREILPSYLRAMGTI